MERIDVGSSGGPTSLLAEHTLSDAPEDQPQPKRPEPRLADHLADGQIVIIGARWLLVLAGLLLTLWSPGPDAMHDIRLRVPVLLLLAGGNFYLHAQLLMRRPVAPSLVYVVSAADMVVITLLLLSQGGFDAPLYIFYFPALLALSVAFSTPMVIGFTGIMLGMYATISLPGALNSADGLPVLIMRLLMLVAVAVCGQLYSRVEARRRSATSDAFDVLLAQTHRADTPQT